MYENNLHYFFSRKMNYTTICKRAEERKTILAQHGSWFSILNAGVA